MIDKSGPPRVDDEAIFKSLLTRFQAGEVAAGDELWSRYQEEIRRSVRARLRHPALRRAVDSLDICQTVARRLCQHIHEYPFKTPADFRRLVGTMVRNRVNEIARHAIKLNSFPTEGNGTIEQLEDDASTDQTIAEEIWNRARPLLSDDEWRLVQLRIVEGRPWKEIAAFLGENEDALQQRLKRALARVREELEREE